MMQQHLIWAESWGHCSWEQALAVLPRLGSVGRSQPGAATLGNTPIPALWLCSAPGSSPAPVALRFGVFWEEGASQTLGIKQKWVKLLLGWEKQSGHFFIQKNVAKTFIYFPMTVLPTLL